MRGTTGQHGEDCLIRTKGICDCGVWGTEMNTSQHNGVSDIAATLQERGNRYGSFEGHAQITQALKAAMCGSKNWARLSDDQREALEMIVHKIGRILNGDPDYADSWHDIAGYAKLVEDRLNQMFGA